MTCCLTAKFTATVPQPDLYTAAQDGQAALLKSRKPPKRAKSPYAPGQARIRGSKLAMSRQRSERTRFEYCNQDGTLRYPADTVNVRRRQKCCKTAELPDMPVRNETRDGDLTRRRSLVRTQHRPLRK